MSLMLFPFGWKWLWVRVLIINLKRKFVLYPPFLERHRNAITIGSVRRRDRKMFLYPWCDVSLQKTSKKWWCNRLNCNYNKFIVKFSYPFASSVSVSLYPREETWEEKQKRKKNLMSKEIFYHILLCLSLSTLNQKSRTRINKMITQNDDHFLPKP